MKSHSVKVEKVVNGGYGLAREPDGRVVMLHNSLPGEEVYFDRIETRRKLVFGRVTAVKQSSHHRLVPPCPYYTQCGGCNLQHCNYPEQLVIKNNILEELLYETAGLTDGIATAVASPALFGYRQRIRLQVEKNQVGFHRHRSKDIIPITSCLLAHPAINDALGQMVQGSVLAKINKNTTQIELLYNPETGNVTAIFHYLRRIRPADRKNAGQLVEETEKLEQLLFIGSDFPLTGPHGSSDQEALLGFRFQLSALPNPVHLQWEAGGFCQVNLGQNINMVNYLLNTCTDLCSPKVLDLFCGMGNFSIPLAHLAQTLIGVEGQGSGIRAANVNSKTANLHNTSFIKDNSFAYCSYLASRQEQFDLIIVDPPRQGIIAMVPALAAIARHRLIYVSCDPATLGRDLKALAEKGFFTISVMPFDMFPQTHHIESVAILEKH